MVTLHDLFRNHGEASAEDQRGEQRGEPPHFPWHPLLLRCLRVQLCGRGHLLPRDTLPEVGQWQALPPGHQGEGHCCWHQGEELVNTGKSWFLLVALEHNVDLVCLQVDKGTAGLNGTDGETTTQGTFVDWLIGRVSKSTSMTIVRRAASPQVLMGCRSAVPSIRRMVATLPSGGVSLRSQTAAPQLSPLQKTPMCSPDTLASANRWSSTADSANVLKCSASCVVSHVSFSTEWTGAYCGARDPSRWRPRPAALPVRHRKGQFQNVQQSSSCWNWWQQTRPRYV